MIPRRYDARREVSQRDIDGDAVSVVGIGVDAVDIPRLRRAVERTPTLLQRVFTDHERGVCTTASGQLRFGGLAARFAAKEALAKALGTGISGFGFRDVEVWSDDDGRPALRLHGGARQQAALLGVTQAHLSLTTSAELGIANVLLESAGAG